MRGNFTRRGGVTRDPPEKFSSRRMKDPQLLRIRFRDVAIGQSFYDPISAEYFVKRSKAHAAMISGIGDGKMLDEFEADDIVGVGSASAAPSAGASTQ